MNRLSPPRFLSTVLVVALGVLLLGAGTARADQSKPTKERLDLVGAPQKSLPLWEVDRQLFLESKDAPPPSEKTEKMAKAQLVSGALRSTSRLSSKNK